MKVVGIVTEYNPFHYGHLYQIQEIKRITNADRIVVVMSGDFVQRGTCAILPKQERTKMALLNSVDVVFELPVCYATASAEFFAHGAVSLLNSLGIVDHLCFGSECGDLELLNSIADFLMDEPNSYQKALTDYQKAGETFPKARALALIDTLQYSGVDKEHLSQVVSSPNNILGIEYLKALKKLNSNIKPFTILRKGAAYHSSDITEHNASATAIRAQLTTTPKDLMVLQVPEVCKEILSTSYQRVTPMIMDDFSTLLYYQLTQRKDQLSIYQDVSSDFACRVVNLLAPGLSYTEFAQALKTKQWTLTRVYRSLLHILLQLTQEDFQLFNENQTMYARLLGFRKESSDLLRKIQKQEGIPIITKVADAKRQLNDIEYKMFCQNLDATHLYQQVIFSKFQTKCKDEYSVGPIIL